MSTVSFAVTDEQQLLRDTVREALRKRATSARVREVMMTDDAADEDGWRELAELGLVGLLISEADGGSGAGVVEAAIVAEELGRVLLPVPFLSSAVFGAALVTAAGSEDQRASVLPGVAAGTTKLAVAHLDTAGHLTADPGVRAVRDGDSWVLDGQAGFVIDGLVAETIVTAATTDDGLALFLVPAGADGLSRERVPVLDLTRPMATVAYEGVRVADTDRLAGGDAVTALHRATATATAVLANEQVGGATRCLEDATAYAKERIQFGRAIGSFQAVKHKLAETLVKVESARSAAYHAARAVAAEDSDEAAIAVPLAASFCAEVYETASADALQIFGGIGFTWEHDIHLYFKRAKASKLLLGSPRHHRRLLGDVLGL
ncbi:MAG: acyl-CoA dehydrogenase family protein [Nitriliruptor sp.]